MSRNHRITILAGDGIGPEVMDQAVRVLEAVEATFNFTVTRTDTLRKDIRENINLLGQLPGGSPTNNVDNLDADHDGQACEAFDYGGGGGGTGGGGTGGGGTGTLANTGPQNKTLLPAGTALLVAGLALVGVTRYRARHVRR